MSNSEYQRRYRQANGRGVSERAQSKACNAAVKYVRHNHPRVWRRLLDEAYAELLAERKKPGRPPAASQPSPRP